MGLSIGDEAPDFDLEGIDGATGDDCRVRLSEHRGSPVVLAFYPADGSPVCTAQLGEYTEHIGRFDSVDATVLAISPQSPESHREFAAANEGFAFPLLSDEDKAVAHSYGNVGLLGLYRRSTFVVDLEGRVAWMHRYIGPGLGFKPVDDLVAAVRAVL